MAGHVGKIPHLVDNMKDLDSDLRFMALQDLRGILSGMMRDDARLEKAMEAKVVAQWTKMLDDANAEVQTESTNCIPALLNIVSPAHVAKIVQSLMNHLLKGSDRQRDIAAIGLQSVVGNLAPESPQSNRICLDLVEKMLTAIGDDGGKAEDSLYLEILDLLLEIALRLGKALAPFHETMAEIFFKRLEYPRLAVRKRVVRALGAIMPAVEDKLFNDIVVETRDRLGTGVERTPTGTAKIGAERDCATFVELAATASREDPERFAPHLKGIADHVIALLKECEQDEVKECCIQTLESFALRCPREVESHLETLLEITLEYLAYDPNYNYDDDEDDDNDDEDDDDLDFGDSDDEDYADDEDISWRVRRACASLMARIVETQTGMLGELATQLTPALVKKFKEREETVRIEVFLTYRALLQQVRAVYSTESARAEGAMEEEPVAVKVLVDSVGAIVKALEKQHKDKNLQVRQGILRVLMDIATAMPGSLELHLPTLVQQVQHMISDKTSSANVKIDSLVLLQTLFKTHDAAAFAPLIQDVTPAVVAAVNDGFYKVASEGLRTTTLLATVLRPNTEQQMVESLRGPIDDLYEAAFKRFSAVDIDQEIKERAIFCVAQILYTVGDEIPDKVAPCLPIFLSRLQNEITRITATKAIAQLAASPVQIDLSPIAQEVYMALASFLRKTSRQLRVTSLMALQVLVGAYDEGTQSELCGLLENMGGGVTQKSKRRKVHIAEVTPLAIEAFSIILAELPPLIDSSDLTSAHLSLALVTQIIRIHPALAERLEGDAAIPIMPQVLKLSVSPILQGAALDALQQCLRKLATSGVSSLGVESLLRMLLEPILTDKPAEDSQLAIAKQAFNGLAKCIATLAALNPGGVIPLAKTFLAHVQAEDASESLKMISLFVLGEIGRDIDISSLGDVQAIISTAFSSSSESVKKAAAFALGNVSAGNAALYLPKLIAEIRAQPPHGYLLLHSLKELVSCKAATQTGAQTLITFVKDIWELLFEYSAAEDEGTRAVVAECIGKIVLVDAKKNLPELVANLGSESAAMRCTMIQAFKITVASSVPGIDEFLKPILLDFFKLMTDDDLHVRRIALVAFDSAMHTKPQLMKPILVNVLPMLYHETKVRQEHIRSVKIGPFTEKFDDGLDTRKTAFECLFTVLERCYDFITVSEFIHDVGKGLADHHDIKAIVHLCLLLIAKRNPTAIKDSMRDLTAYFDKILSEKGKKSDVRVHIEKREDRKRAVCRTVKAFCEIDGAEQNEALQIMVKRIEADPLFSEWFSESSVDRVRGAIGMPGPAMELV